MPRHLTPTILFAAQFLLCAYPAPAQSSASSFSCPCTLQGSVVDSISGQPVPHAFVRLTSPSPRATLTDSEGKFQFESLAAGSVTLEGEKPGFLTRDPLGRWSLPSVTLQLTPNNSPAILKLIPEGVITGQVSDENG
jgi:Carboxypeptidase regulatory-like domain